MSNHVSEETRHKRKIGNHCVIHYFPGELIDDLVIDLFASSEGDWNKYVMIECRMLMIMSRKKRDTNRNLEIIAYYTIFQGS